MFYKKNADLVSIIVPNFNNEKYLTACIESVFKQTHKNLEVLIIDDSSEDNSLKIIKDYSEKNSKLKLIALDKNVGVSRARNIGIRSAKGRYLTTLDSDDILIDKQKIDKEIQLIKRFEKQGKNIIAFSNITRLKESGEKGCVVGTDTNVKEGMILLEMLQRSAFIPRDFLCKRSIYEEVGLYDENIEMYEDWDIKLRIAKKYPYHFTSIEGIGYRDRPGGLSKVGMKEHEKWKKVVFQKNMLGKHCD